MKWETSNGAFHTTKVGNLDMEFTDFSNSKYFSIRPDIVEIRDDEPESVFDLILGVQTLTRFGVKLDFGVKTMTLDQITNAMQPLEAFKKKRKGTWNFSQKTNFPGPPLEPISTREATKRTIEILDAEYEKADLPKIVQENCSHLSKDE